MFVKVAVNIPTGKTFTYSVPETLRPRVAVGVRVLVPFGTRRQTGCIVAVLSDPDNGDGSPLRDILSVADPEPLFTVADLAFYSWVADYCFYPLGKALSEILPGPERRSVRRLFATSAACAATEGDLACLPERQREVLETLLVAPRGMTRRTLLKQYAALDLDRSVRSLRERGLVEDLECLGGRAVTAKTERLVCLSSPGEQPEDLTAAQKEVVRLAAQEGEVTVPRLVSLSGRGRGVILGLIRRGVLSVRQADVLRASAPVAALGGPATPIVPNADQQAALQAILSGLEVRRFTPCLLHGVTGSGKTEVYFLAIAEVLRQGGSVLFLVPEIGLTPQLLGRFSERFPHEPLAVLHSGVPPSVRYDSWRRICRGEIRVVVGARSALFAPLRGLRLIVVDEEHDESYKQEDRMRYNARDLALVKGRMEQATVVLGSATPAIQTYHHALSGRYTALSLPRRVEDRPLPRMEIVDMRLPENESGGVGDTGPTLSRRLKEALRETLADGKQTLLLLNRRGFHTFLLCRDCGYVLRCPHCDLALTLHARAGICTCHHCDYSLRATTRCPRCGGKRIAGYGVGTERLEEMVGALFPFARIARMDRDTTSRAGSHEALLRSLAAAEIDILVGTQMISKGHDFPGVVLVGVLSADTSLNVADFRASEKTFQLLTQVAGRGGRGDSPGRVIIQTFNPGSYVLKRVQDHDYAAFYEEEIALRKGLAYPPFSRMVNVRLSCGEQDQGREGVKALGRRARELAGANGGPPAVEVIGPAEAPLTRIRGRYRWQLLLKGRDSQALHAFVHDLLAPPLPAGIEALADVDPMNFM